MALEGVNGPVVLDWGESALPIYGNVARFDTEVCALRLRGGAVDYRRQAGARAVRRVGYDLFYEVRYLLTEGQPARHASTPTLELHIAFLRDLLLESGVPFVEIPPRPAKHDFICCLTHDIDFFGIQRHRFDWTLAGFIARASLGTIADLVRGRRSLAEAARNFVAVLSLPLVFLGLLPDLWRPLDDYARVEDARRSTFFLLPFKDRPGVAPDGSVDATRAAPYQVSEICHELTEASARGSELAVHGIDAWRDAEAGRAEMNQLTTLTGRQTAGVRMHWLYFANDSGRRLEAAGFCYDSTWGYNEAVGYRAGTSQIFRLPETTNLMELPMSIMDTALLATRRMGLAQNDALRLCREIVTNARRFGGTLVINWHDRSLVPERLWGRLYQQLLSEVGRDDRALFATASDAVDWFRRRRSIRFAADSNGTVTVAAPPTQTVAAAALVRVHRPTETPKPAVEEYHFDGREELTLSL